MLPRTKGIFHLGEEGGEAKKTSRAATIRELECSKGTCERFEGLRIILIQHSRQRSNVVIKSSMKSCMQNTRPHLSPRASAPQLGFLKLCFLCKRELSPHKDVYMYRGDQGFCSEECRRRQILLDERRELEVSTRERSKAPHDRRAANKVHESDRHRRILVVA